MAVLKRVDKNNNDNTYVLYMQGEKLVFKRNNLDTDAFEKTDSGWRFSEEFFYYGRWCYFCIEGKGSIKSYFPTNMKSLLIRGSYHGFGIRIKAKVKNNPPIVIKNNLGDIRIHFECRGNKKIAVRDKNGKYAVPMVKGRPKGEERPQLPASAWSVSHPYQGGGTSPK